MLGCLPVFLPARFLGKVAIVWTLEMPWFLFGVLTFLEPRNIVFSVFGVQICNVGSKISGINCSKTNLQI